MIDQVVFDEVEIRVRGSLSILEDLLNNPEKANKSPLIALMGFTTVIQNLREAITLMEGD